MADILNKGKLGHTKSGIIVSCETLIKNRYCNIHNKTVGVGKVGWIYATSSLYPSQHNSSQQTVKKHRSGHTDSWNEALRGFFLWLWVPDCKGRFLGLEDFICVGRWKKRRLILWDREVAWEKVKCRERTIKRLTVDHRQKSFQCSFKNSSVFSPEFRFPRLQVLVCKQGAPESYLASTVYQWVCLV